MPKLIRLYIQQVAIGFVLSAVFVAALLWLNIANLAHLVSHTDGGTLAVVLLWLFNGIVFAGVQFGIAIMRMADNDEAPRGPRHPAPASELRPIPVTAQEIPAKRLL